MYVPPPTPLPNWLNPGKTLAKPDRVSSPFTELPLYFTVQWIWIEATNEFKIRPEFCRMPTSQFYPLLFFPLLALVLQIGPIPTFGNLLPTYLPTYLLTYLPTYLPIYLPTYLSTYLLTYLPTYLPTYLLTYLPAYLPTYQPLPHRPSRDKDPLPPNHPITP